MNQSSILNQEVATKYKEPIPPPIDKSEFLKIIKSRRSVRKFTDKKIPADLIKECLTIATLAPSSSNLQPWEFYWVRDPEKKSKLADACLGQNAAKTASDLIVVVSRTDTWRRNAKLNLEIMKAMKIPVPEILNTYYKKIVPFAYSVGFFSSLFPFKWLIVNVAKIFTATPTVPLNQSDLRIWAIKSTALACENFMLAVRANGFDSCPMEGFDSKKVKSLLKLNSYSDIVMVIGVGERSEGGIYNPKIMLPENLVIFEV